MKGNDQNRPVLKYIGLFGLIYFVFSVILAMLQLTIIGHYYYDFLAIGVSGSIAANRFIKESGRLFTKIEKRKLITGTFFCAMAMNILTGVILSRNWVIYKFYFTFIGFQMLDLFAIRLVFGPLSKSVYQQRKK